MMVDIVEDNILQDRRSKTLECPRATLEFLEIKVKKREVESLKAGILSKVGILFENRKNGFPRSIRMRTKRRQVEKKLNIAIVGADRKKISNTKSREHFFFAEGLKKTRKVRAAIPNLTLQDKITKETGSFLENIYLL